MASINDVESWSPEMVSVTELGNGMIRPSTHLLDKTHARKPQQQQVVCCCSCRLVALVVVYLENKKTQENDE